MNLSKNQQDFSQLDSYLSELSFSLEAEQIRQYQIFLTQLLKWNQAYNLTAIKAPRDIIIKHLLDSLVISPYLLGESILDIGSGAGFPGIPLAIAQPNTQFYLLDSNSKKTRFIKQMKLELNLANLHVIHSRVQDYQKEGGFDMIISRAFASVADMVYWSSHLLSMNGVIGAMKGKIIEDEFSALPDFIHIKEVIQLEVPYLAEERHFILMEKQ